MAETDCSSSLHGRCSLGAAVAPLVVPVRARHRRPTPSLPADTYPLVQGDQVDRSSEHQQPGRDCSSPLPAGLANHQPAITRRIRCGCHHAPARPREDDQSAMRVGGHNGPTRCPAAIPAGGSGRRPSKCSMMSSRPIRLRKSRDQGFLVRVCICYRITRLPHRSTPPGPNGPLFAGMLPVPQRSEPRRRRCFRATVSPHLDARPRRQLCRQPARRRCRHRLRVAQSCHVKHP
jgi:hypothetical protein